MNPDTVTAVSSAAVALIAAVATLVANVRILVQVLQHRNDIVSRLAEIKGKTDGEPTPQ